MPELTTITASITYPIADIEEFADKLGYPSIVANPDYVPAQGAEQIVDPKWEGSLTDPNIPMVNNPDYVPAVGEPTIPNPESKEEYVKRLFKAMATKWFTQFAERDITRLKQAEAEAAIAEVKSRVEGAISI